jgi:alpha-mannosidase
VVRLAAGGAGDRIEFDNDVDWYERATLLKAAFPLTCPNDSVVYDIGLGTVKRGLNHPELYEVPGHQWADMTSRDGEYGVAILNDCKYGWDHPNDTTLRLTLIHTPGVYDSWAWVGDQKSQDNGQHKFTFAVQGHPGDWRDGGVVWQAARFNQPLITFQAPSHAGVLGKEFSFAAIEQREVGGDPLVYKSSTQVMLNAVKLAEDTDEIVVRVRELNGKPADGVRLRLVRPIVAARQVNGVEEMVGPVEVKDGMIEFSLKPYQPKAFALRLAAVKSTVSARPEYQPISLPFDLDGISLDADRQDGDFDGSGNTLSGDLLPDTLVVHDVPFLLGSKAPKALNVVRCAGQTIPLPASSHNRLYAIASAVGGPAVGRFLIGDRQAEVALPDYAMKVGQWNNRMVNGRFLEEPRQIAPSYINRTPVAWAGTHRHSSTGENEAYQFTYLYLLEFPIPAGAKTITLPNEPRIRLLAMTAVNTLDDDIRPGKPLYDVANGTVTTIAAERNTFLDSLHVRMGCPIPRAVVHYTVDGSDPTSNSPAYDGPFSIAKTTTVRARAILAGANDEYVSSAEFKKLAPREPTRADKLEPGLDAAYYEGDWSKLPNFDTVRVQKSFVADSIAIPSFARKEKYGLMMTGFVKVPTDGMYDFYLSSDDGSTLAVGDTLLIDNDGLHGSGDVAGAIALKAGVHRLVVRMFQAGGDQDLKVSLAGPTLKKRPVPKEMLFHAVTGKRR